MSGKNILDLEGWDQEIIDAYFDITGTYQHDDDVAGSDLLLALAQGDSIGKESSLSSARGERVITVYKTREKPSGSPMGVLVKIILFLLVIFFFGIPILNQIVVAMQ